MNTQIYMKYINIHEYTNQFDLCIHVHGGSMRGKHDILHLVNLIPLINI